ncbi:MAG TPA: hypothetical protein VMT18_05170 [Planctomycetota bacterium]|nr:hypothetical protein [Planctomycetota bacterium]
MIAGLFALAACAAPQEVATNTSATPRSADGARERLEELIASTNALAGFRAEFVLRSGEEELGRVELAYAAPDRMTMSNSSDRGWVRRCIRDDALWMESDSPAAGFLFGAFRFDDRDGTFEQAIDVLDEAFPRPEDHVEVSAQLEWSVNASTDKTEFDLKPEYVRTGDERLLGWLHTMRSKEGGLSLDGDALLHVSPRVRAEVDAKTGFLRRLHMVGVEGEERELVLVALDLEGPFADELFARPDPPEGARDMTETLRGQVFSPARLRTDCLLQIDGELRRGRAWDEATQGFARRFLEALHRPALVANVERWKAGVLAGIDEFAAELDQRRAAGDDESALQETIDARRATLVESTSATLARLIESLASATRNPDPSAHWVDLRALEDQVLGDLYRDEVEAPLLAAFDERT